MECVSVAPIGSLSTFSIANSVSVVKILSKLPLRQGPNIKQYSKDGIL